MIKVGIIDGNQQSRGMMRVMLDHQQQYNFKVTLEAGSMGECKKVQPSQEPNVLLLDIEENGVDSIMEIYRKFPNTNVVIYSNIQDHNSVLACVKAGAMGYLTKDTCVNEVISTIVTTHKGGSVFSPSISRNVIQHVQQTIDYQSNLSFRERQIVEGLKNGLSYKLIGYKYGISLDTVRQYIKRTYKKLNINSKGELLAQFK
ncbi:response regulator transcription factor [Pedobacter sp. MC2016-15]|jgi:two-component system nitrate/nitrite response regulator NarP|uniref:response regulator transcription factor n=1 Tax=Pedobacter sp. MC2016-15 TaxID=2994473 RepID=UPI002245453F|nr:response regulator transcription factor [Pedobacter sp. MC2016-15]MCX2481185.1 response regulator transcription factor [Pedobacter sp. MC2016-15]